jgi:dTDP-4-amino-4,6-dideoxygalactose transaminase
MSFKILYKFENLVAKFFGASYAIATDSCTHAIELCLRYQRTKKISIPVNTYLSIPMLGSKLNLNWKWKRDNWKDYYYIGGTNIIDAAVFWKKKGYIKNTFMCVSFQFQKHINIGKGGIILTDNKEAYLSLIKMSYDGRDRTVKWRDQNIISIGYHYYMTPESAKKGIEIFKKKSNLKPRQWSYKDYPNLQAMKVFK